MINIILGLFQGIFLFFFGAFLYFGYSANVLLFGVLSIIVLGVRIALKRGRKIEITFKALRSEMLLEGCGAYIFCYALVASLFRITLSYWNVGYTIILIGALVYMLLLFREEHRRKIKC